MVKYPDFTKNFTYKQIEEWANKNGLTVIKQEIATKDYEEGTIIAQDKPEGYLVYPGTTFKITIEL